jgi:molybdopterin molybdotransferase
LPASGGGTALVRLLPAAAAEPEGGFSAGSEPLWGNRSKVLFFNVKSAAEARALLRRPTAPPASEAVCITDAAGRVPAREVLSPIALPEFPRAVVDGFAVRAQDTFGASASLPSYLRLAGEVLMGKPPAAPLAPGEAARIATGGMLPDGADAVVMVEYAETVAGDMVEVLRPAAPGEGMVRAGDDLAAGDLLVPRGRRLRPQDVAALAGAGVTEVEVFARPRVAVIPTGEEVVPADRQPGPGQVRDMNTPALSAALRAAGALPKPYPVVPDEPEALRAAVEDAVATTDLALIAGGSSVGTRDWTLEVLLSFPGAELLLHGVSIRPGKPVIVVALGEKLLVGLPGNPVSALVVFDRFVAPYLRRLAGEERLLPAEPRVMAKLSRSYSSDAGKEDYVRVRLLASEEGYLAEPLLGKSTLIMTLAEADGLVVVPEGVEGLEEGETVEVLLFP